MLGGSGPSIMTTGCGRWALVFHVQSPRSAGSGSWSSFALASSHAVVEHVAPPTMTVIASPGEVFPAGRARWCGRGRGRGGGVGIGAPALDLWSQQTGLTVLREKPRGTTPSRGRHTRSRNCHVWYNPMSDLQMARKLEEGLKKWHDRRQDLETVLLPTAHREYRAQYIPKLAEPIEKAIASFRRTGEDQQKVPAWRWPPPVMSAWSAASTLLTHVAKRPPRSSHGTPRHHHRNPS
jgi:hypothetical protein